jgi:hypothetical protein
MQCFRVIISLALALILWISYPLQAIAQERILGINLMQKIFRIVSPPKESGAPATRSANTIPRGECSAIASSASDQFVINQLSLIALIPPVNDSSNQEEKTVWGKTLEEYPSLWFYIPFVYKKSELEFGKFIILNEDKSKVGKPIFFQLRDDDNRDLDDKPIIAKFTLPENQKPLEINKQYNWYFSILCDKRKPSRNPSVSGWIEREGEDFSSPKNYLEYADSAILYDAMTDLIENKSTTPEKQIQEDWDAFVKYLLSSIGLNENGIDKFSIINRNDKLINAIKNAPIVELKPVPEKVVRDSGFEI